VDQQGLLHLFWGIRDRQALVLAGLMKLVKIQRQNDLALLLEIEVFTELHKLDYFIVYHL
jgi:hypothetical protein